MNERVYDCGCVSRDGIVIARCAWAAERKTRLEALEQTARGQWQAVERVGEDGSRETVRQFVWTDAREAGALTLALSAHYPSRFAAVGQP